MRSIVECQVFKKNLTFCILLDIAIMEVVLHVSINLYCKNNKHLYYSSSDVIKAKL